MLHVVVSHDRRAADPTSDPSSMAIDAPSSSELSTVPALPSFLATCVLYPVSPAPLRAAIRHHLPSPEDLLPLLKVIDWWLGQWGTNPTKLMPTKGDVVTGPDKVLHVRTKDKKRTLPPLDKVIIIWPTRCDTGLTVHLDFAFPTSYPRRVVLDSDSGHVICLCSQINLQATRTTD